MTAFHTLIFQVCLSLLSTSVFALPFQLKTELSHKNIMVNDASATAYIKVALTGLELDQDRPPLNVALVIDRSGSMRGQRLVHAKKAAKLALEMLKPDDILSLIAYESKAEILLPATKVGDGSMARKQIENLRANGSTALYAGTELGGHEVVKFIDKENVNRVILLSDGIANIGPSSPQDLAKLGAKLAGQGIAVSTIGLGLGYNEDLMARLADSSDGNHSFVEHANQLANIMSLELNDALAVVAQNVDIQLTFPKGIRPVKALGRTAKFDGQVVTSKIKQLITGTERFVLIEVEADKAINLDDTPFAQVQVKYRSNAGEDGEATQLVQAKSAKTKADMEQSAQTTVMESVVELIAREQQNLAIKLKDEGQDDKAAQIMNKNSVYLQSNASRYRSKKLKSMETRSKEDQAIIKRKGKGKDWSRTRKSMRKRGYSSKAQMSF